MSRDRSVSSDLLAGRMGAAGRGDDYIKTRGVFRAVFRDAHDDILHEENFDNILTTAGKNFLLDTTLAGSAYTVVGPFMGLISSASYSAVVAADTMGSHTGWLEAGSTNAPTFSARLTCAWSAASSGTKPLSAGLTFTFTGAGTVQGAFIVTGTGAVATLMSGVGTLYAEGVLGTPQPVVSTNTLTLSYSTTLT